MAKKRKYIDFLCESDDCLAVTDSWLEAFKFFVRHASATIYGCPNYDGAKYEVVISK